MEEKMLSNLSVNQEVLMIRLGTKYTFCISYFYCYLVSFLNFCNTYFNIDSIVKTSHFVLPAVERGR